MRSILPVLLLLLIGCAQHSTADPAGDAASAGREPDAQQLKRLEAEARALARTEGCNQADQCRTAPVGDRPCGGPRDYLVYCVATTDTLALFRKLEELKRAEQEFNRRHQLISTCELRLPPETRLVGTSCQAATGAVLR